MTVNHDHSGIKRRTILKTIGAGAVGVAGLLGASGTAAAVGYTNPQYEPHFPDPTIYNDDGTYYAYGTNMDRDDGSNDSQELLVPILSSTDLVNWTYEGEAFTSRPGWVYGSIWAPDIHRYNGQWVMFYSLRPRNGGEFGIGLATSDSPTGPFTDHGRVISDSDHENGGTIDAYFVEHNNTPYLFFGSFHGIYLIELTPDLQSWHPSSYTQVAGNAYEGAIHFEANEYHYLMPSTGGCCDGLASTYEYEIGRSTSFSGPYYNQNGTDLMNRNANNKGVPVLTGNRRFPGPGHGDVMRYDDGSLWTVYHAYDAQDGGWVDGVPRRVLLMDRIEWENDWPVIGCTNTPTEAAQAPGSASNCTGPVSGPLPEGTYHITNVNSSKLLEVANAGTENGTTVQQYADTGCTCQQWNLSQNRDGTYHITNVNSGLYMEVVDAEYGDGANIQQFERSGHPCQRWNVIDNGDGTYRLEAEHSGTVADVYNAQTSDGANVIQWSYWGGDNQKWTFESV
ncbi:family 43 glycosylhydrolase [Halocatena halophila]|uniref:family 43 glycosylhydrolase n=1 Tax=Halocatena halophila TaxID=2814576 RepID=UPI002ED25119